MLKTYRPSEIKDTQERLAFWRQGTYEIVARKEDELNRAAMAYERIMRGNAPPTVKGGAPPYYVQTLQVMTAAVTANTFTSAASIIGAGERGPNSPDYFKTIGASWKQEAFGIIGTTGTPTFALGTYFGVVAGTITTVLCITPTITTASALANINWYWMALSRTVAITSTTATMLTTGILFGDIEVLGTTVASEPQQWAVNATPPTNVTTDLSSLVYIDLKATWGTSSVSNSTTVNFYVLTSLYA